MLKRFLSIVIAVIICGASQLVHAWSEDGHRLVTEFALIDVIEQYSLSQPVEVTPLSRFLEKFYREAHKSQRFRSRILEKKEWDPASPHWFQHYLRINPAVAIDYFELEEKIGSKVRPIDILIWHSSDPDDGRDQNLNIHRYQRNFGGTSGPSSQAFRHMEKPPFLLFNLTSTIGLPLRRAGEASKRAHIYFDLARIAKELGEDYWMWRFLACSFHYIEDLTQPYHTTEISSRGRLWNRARRMQLREKTGKSLREILTTLVTNSHHWFESYTSTLMKNDRSAYLKGRTEQIRPEVAQMFASLQGSSVDMKQGSIRRYSVKIRNVSNMRSPDLLESVFFISDDRLRGLYEFNQDTQEDVEPLEFVNPVKDEEFQKYEQRFFKLVYRSHALAGEALRTAVDELEVTREPRTMRRLVWELMRLR